MLQNSFEPSPRHLLGQKQFEGRAVYFLGAVGESKVIRGH